MVLLQAECSALPSFQLQRQGMYSFRYHRCKLVSMSFLDRKGPAFGPQISLQEQSPPNLPLNSALSAGKDGFPGSGHEGATVARPVLAVREEQMWPTVRKALQLFKCCGVQGHRRNLRISVEPQRTCCQCFDPHHPEVHLMKCFSLLHGCPFFCYVPDKVNLSYLEK